MKVLFSIVYENFNQFVTCQQRSGNLIRIPHGFNPFSAPQGLHVSKWQNASSGKIE
jgi:hypothetical protein